MLRSKLTGTALATLASIAMAATPAHAAPLQQQAAPSANPYAANVWTPGDMVQEHHRGRYRHHRHRDRVDAGDVIAGVLVVGAIAAVASAATSDRRDDRRARCAPRTPCGEPRGEYRNQDYRSGEYDPRYREQRYDTRDARDLDGARYASNSGLANAANMCRASIETSDRRASVDAVNRDASGWRATGRLDNGQSFTCRIGADGRVAAIEYGSDAYSAGMAPSQAGYTVVEDNQHSGATYRALRERRGDVVQATPQYEQPRRMMAYRDVAPSYRQPDTAQQSEYTPPRAEGPQPSYPGGLLPGESYDSFPGDEQTGQ